MKETKCRCTSYISCESLPAAQRPDLKAASLKSYCACYHFLILEVIASNALFLAESQDLFVLVLNSNKIQLKLSITKALGA